MRRIVFVFAIGLILIGCLQPEQQPVEVSGIEKIEVVQPPPYYHGDRVTVRIEYSGVHSMQILLDGNVLYSGGPKGSFDLDLTFGKHTLEVRGFDENGAPLNSEFLTLEVHDPTPPVVEISTDPREPTDSEFVALNMIAQDPESGIVESYVKDLDTGEIYETLPVVLILDAGVHRFMGYAKNGDGKITTSVLEVRVRKSDDSTPPEILLHVPGAVEPGAEFQVFVHVEDESGLESLKILLDGEVLKEANPMGEEVYEKLLNVIAPDGEGTMRFSVEAVDVVGNSSRVDADVIVTRNNPPSVQLWVDETNPSVGEEVHISVEATDEDLERVDLYVGDELVRSFADFESMEYTYTPDTPGLKSITAIARDSAGLESRDTVRLLVGEIDETPPRIRFSPPEEVPVGIPWKFVAVVSDDVDVSGVKFVVSATDTVVSDAVDEGMNIYSIVHTFDETGDYTISVRAVDTSGNESEVSKVVRVLPEDIVKSPKVMFTVHPSVLGMEDTLHAVVTAEDEDGLSKADFYVDDDLIDSKAFGNSNNLEFDWIVTSYGEHTAKVVVFDVLGYTTEATAPFLVTVERPMVEFTSPSTGSEYPYSEGMEIALMVKVIDTASPVEYRFDVIGPESTTLTPEESGEMPNYVFSASWKPGAPGSYRIRFTYTNDLNLSDSTEVEVEIKDTAVIFRKPSTNFHDAGIDMEVEILAAKSVESGKLVLVKPDSSEHDIALNMVTREDGSKLFTGVVPGSLLDTLSSDFSYTLKFTAYSGEVEVVYTFPFRVVDTLPPELEVKINGETIPDGSTVTLNLYSSNILTVSATDNYRFDRISVYGKSGLLLSEVENTVSMDLSLDPLENPFRIVAVDTTGNSTELNFTAFAKEDNSPVATPSNVELIPVEGTVLNINAQTEINYSDFEIEDDTELERVYYEVTGPMGFEQSGVLWEEDGVRYTRISVDRNGNFIVRFGDVPGFYFVKLMASDIFGNTVLLGQEIMEIRDLVPPVLRLEIDSEDIERYHDSLPVISGDVGITVYAMDNLGSIRYIGLRVEDEDGNTVEMTSPEFPGNFHTFTVDTRDFVDGVLKITGIATASDGTTSTSYIDAILDNFKLPYVSVELPAAETFGGLPVYSGVLRVNLHVSSISIPSDIKKLILFMDGATVDYVDNPDSGSVELSIDTTEYVGVSPHTISASVVDDAGNVSEALAGVNIHEAIFDNTPPLPDYSAYGTTNVLVTDTDVATLYFLEDTAVDEILVHLWKDSSEHIMSTDRGNATVISATEVSMDLDSFFTTESSANYEYYAYDQAENVGVGTGVFYYDTSEPEGTITEIDGLRNGIVPPDGATLTVELHDPLTWVKKVIVHATDNQSNSSEPSEYDVGWIHDGSWEFTWYPFESSEGTARIFVELFDAADHSTTTSTDLSYDALAPRLTTLDFEPVVTHPDYPDLMFASDTSATITVEGTDLNFDELRVEMYVGISQTFSDSSSDSNYTHDLTLSGDATHTVRIELVDLAGNSVASVSTLICDVSSPTISAAVLVDLTTSISTELGNGSTVTLTSEELDHTFNLRVEFEEPYPNVDEIWVEGSDTTVDYFGDTDGRTYKTFVLRFSTDDTLTIHVEDVVGHYATWMIYVDAP